MNRGIVLDGNTERLGSRLSMRSQAFAIGLRSGLCADLIMRVISSLAKYVAIGLAQ